MICPDFAWRQAQKAEIPDDRIQDLWDQHVERADQRGARDYGGGPWLALCASAAKRMAEAPTVRRADPDVARMRKLEREAKELEDEEYRKTAISFREFCAEVGAAWAMNEGLTPAEAQLGEHVDQHGLPGPGADPVSWLLRRLEGLDVRRVQRCHCGADARSWVKQNVRYYGALCEACSAKERAAKAEARKRGAA